MKTKTCSLSLVKLSIIITIFLTGCAGESEQNVNDSNSIDSASSSINTGDSLCKFFRPQEKRDMALPVSANEYRYIRGYSYFAFDVLNDDGISVLPELVDPMVKIEDFINYCLSNDTNVYKGIRVYPGLTKDNKLVTIMCLAKEGDNSQEISYRIFDNIDYVNNPFPSPPTPFKADTLHTAYIENVRIFGIQPVYDNTNTKHRISRFYYWKELHELFKSNIIPFDIKRSDTYRNYKVKMEIGFIPDFLTAEYNTLNPLQNRDFYEGYTIIFHVVDKNGNPLIDPSATRRSGEPYYFKNLYLEVGSPCPPVCGELHND